MKIGGGNAGHNGLRSITEHLGNDYRRVRIGIGHPGDKARVHDYVLGNFAKAEHPWVEAILAAIAANAGYLADGADNSFQNKIFLAMQRLRVDCPTSRRLEFGAIALPSMRSL